MKTLRDEVIEMLYDGNYDSYNDEDEFYRLADDVAAFAELHNALQASDVELFMTRAKVLVDQISSKDNTISTTQRANRKHKRTIEQLNRENHNLRHKVCKLPEETLAELVMDSIDNQNVTGFDIATARGAMHISKVARLLMRNKRFTNWCKDNVETADIYINEVEDLRNKLEEAQRKNANLKRSLRIINKESQA